MNITLQGYTILKQNNRRISPASVVIMIGVGILAAILLGQALFVPKNPRTAIETSNSVIPPELDTPSGTVAERTAVEGASSPAPSTNSTGAKNLGSLGSFQQDSKIEITLSPEEAGALSSSGNPFEIGVNVAFTGPSGQTYVVPAFFDGDGAGGQEGNVWKVRFFAESPGEWTFQSKSDVSQLDGFTGEFEVEEAAGCQAGASSGAQSLACLGTLQYAGGHYLRFKNGDYWIKGGVDDPENFLGDAFGSWNAKKDAVDFLSSKGVNSIYVITNNIDGDRNDTWPWLGDTPGEAKQNSNEFDVARLQLWEDFFTYAESKGVVLNIILNDDSAWNGYNHDLYFKEMVARFGHHPGLIWNLGEEANEIYTDQEQINLAKKLRSLDSYGHPITVHRVDPWPFLGDPNFDLTSLQPMNGALDFSTANIRDQNGVVITHREESAAACRPIAVMIDELPGVETVNDSTRYKMRSAVLYPIFFGGGSFELHYRDAYGPGGNVTIQDLAPMLEDMTRARQFVENLPFNEMRPCNELLSNDDQYCFGKGGDVYTIYLPQGGQVTIDLSGVGGNFDGSWFDPRTGATSDAGSITGGGSRSLTPSGGQDWVLLLDNPQVNGGQSGIGGGFPMLDDLEGQLAFKIYLPTAMQCGG